MVKNRNHRRNSFNVHHVIGRSNEKRAKVEEETNKMLIEVFKHDAINTLFQENQSPHEQLAVMVEIRRPVLSFGVYRTFLDLLRLPKDVFYKKELIK